MITLTDSAIYRINEMKKENKEFDDAVLHFGVTGGGCSGLSYTINFKNTIDKDDEKIQIKDLTVTINKKDVPVVKGTTIDFKQSLMGGGFTIDNPNAIVSCGCGSSFRTKTTTGTAEKCD